MSKNAHLFALSSFGVGFALSGFFDGILLHQVLQWHHLLSASGLALRFQVLADGWFHLAMYAIAVASLGGLLRARRDLDGPGGRRRLAGWALCGFGAWHIVDALLFHWFLGIHRVRMDASDPLLWDLGWLGLFGLLPLAVGVVLLRRPGPRARHRGRATASLLALITVIAGAQSLRAPPDTPVTIVFRNGVPPDRALDAVLRLGGEPVLLDPAGGVYVVQSTGAAVTDWMAAGAVFVAGSGLPPGCFTSLSSASI